MKIGISMCLLGHKCRYDGTDKKDEKLLKLLEGHELIGICPELSSGFPVPHNPIELVDDRAFFKDGNEVTDQLNKGCLICFKLIETCDLLILKSKSPSCGYKKIYDGSFSGKLIDGDGMFASLCIKNNKKIFTEKDLSKIREYISQ